jgi:AraC-like DNA-binding protein
MPIARAWPLPSTAEEFALLSEEMAIFLVRFGPRLAASRVGISERTLRRRFERRGLQLAAYTKESRLKMVPHLLATDLSLRTVADRLGFASPQTFARFIRREFGETATAIRVRLQAGS